MDTQMVLSRVTVVLLFLNALLLGAHSHPLGSLGQTSKLPGVQELLDHLQDEVSELQEKQTALEPLLQDQGSAEAWETERPAPRDASQPQLRPHSAKTMQGSGCFGQKLDRIGSHSRLGCNVMRRF